MFPIESRTLNLRYVMILLLPFAANMRTLLVLALLCVALVAAAPSHKAKKNNLANLLRRVLNKMESEDERTLVSKYT